MTKYLFFLKGLTCAGCAATIEQELLKIEEITGLSLDFIDKELTFYLRDESLRDKILDSIKAVINKIEPDVEIILTEDRRKNVRFRDSIVSSFRSAEVLTAIAGIIIIAAGIFTPAEPIKTVLLIIGYLLIGWQIIYGAARRLFSRYLFNEQFLMSIATIGAIVIGEYLEAIAVMLFYQIGKFLENKVVDYSQKSISELLAITPDFANVEVAGQIIKSDPEKVKTGDILVIKPGERIPLDCTVIEGATEIDNSIITGESLPVAVSQGSKLLSGAINLHSAIKARADKDFASSTISRVVEIIKSAKSKKTDTERLITRFAAIYTPIIIALAFLIAVLPPLFLKDALFREWFYRSLIFLVISCPCALVISVPLSFFSGLAVMVKKGVLMKGAVHIENLALAKTVFVDKTGTLTKGKMTVSRIIPAPGVTEDELLSYAHLAESHSNHPLAIAIITKHHQMQHCSGIQLNLADTINVLNVQEIPGKGLIAETSQGKIVAGNLALLNSLNIKTTAISSQTASIIAVAFDGKYLGTIEFSDIIRSNIRSMIARLQKEKVRIVMLTGDKKEVAENIAAEAGIAEYHYGLTPEEKMSYVARESAGKSSDKGKTIFIGDGINDAPAMTSADVGIAMGGIGAAVSIEAADVVLQTDEIDKLAEIIFIAKKTLNKAKENIIFALGVKAIFLLLGALGLITIWGAVFADVGVTLLAVLNSLKLLKYRNL